METDIISAIAALGTGISLMLAAVLFFQKKTSLFFFGLIFLSFFFQLVEEYLWITELIIQLPYLVELSECVIFLIAPALYLYLVYQHKQDFRKNFKFTAKTLVPIGLVALPGELKSRASLLLLFYQGTYMSGGLNSLAKGSTNRYRPFSYLNMEQINALTGEAKEEFHEDIVDDDVEDSFYSGDAAATSYGFFFFAKVFNDYYPESKWRYGVWGLSAVGTGLDAYFRAKSGKHFPSDVIVGSLIGGGLGILIPHLHKKRDNQSFSLVSIDPLIKKGLEAAPCASFHALLKILCFHRLAYVFLTEQSNSLPKSLISNFFSQQMQDIGSLEIDQVPIIS